MAQPVPQEKLLVSGNVVMWQMLLIQRDLSLIFQGK